MKMPIKARLYQHQLSAWQFVLRIFGIAVGSNERDHSHADKP